MMSKSKSKLVGTVSSPVMLISSKSSDRDISLGKPPTYEPIAAKTIMLPNMGIATPSRPLNQNIDNRQLTTQERLNLSGSTTGKVLYFTGIPNSHTNRRFFLFVEEMGVNGRPQLRLIPYQGVTNQTDHQNLIREYREAGESIASNISTEMTWRFGRFTSIDNTTQAAQIIINGLSPFTTNFMLVDAQYSTEPPYRLNIKAMRFNWNMRANGDLGLFYGRLVQVSRTAPSASLGLDVERSESSKGINLLTVGVIALAGICAYKVVTSKK